MKFLKFFFALLAAIVSLTVSAVDFKYTYEGKELTYTINGSECTVKAGTSSKAGNTVSGDLIIPKIAYNGTTPYPVTAIGTYAFYKCTGLTSIKIEEGVTSIGTDALRNCQELKSILIPKTIKEIKDGVFENCSNLTNVIIEDGEEPISLGVGSTIAISGQWYTTGLFYDTKLDSLYIGRPLNLNYDVGDYKFSPFRTTSGSTTVIMGANAQSIGTRLFYKCANLKSIHIENGLESIKIEAFYGCSSLDSLTIPASVKTVERNAFYGAYINTLIFEDGEDEVLIATPTYSNNVIFEKSTLKDLYLGRNLSYDKTKAEYAPFYSTSVETVTFGDKVESIGKYLFQNCKNLKSVVLPESVKLVEESAFQGCTGLTSVEMAKVALIHKNAFNGCTSLENVKVGDAARVLENGAFQGCSSIKSINLPAVALIYPKAFMGCTGLQTVTLGQYIRTIQADAFNGCTGMKRMYVYSELPPACEASTFTNVPVITDIHVVKGTRSLYVKDDVWNKFAVFIDDLSADETPEDAKVELSAIGIENGSLRLNLGQQLKITVTVTPQSAADGLTWKSSDSAVASVDRNGNVSAIAEGSAVITVTTSTGISASVTVTVINGKPGDVNGDGELTVADVITLSNYLIGLDVESFDPALADVNGDGEVTFADAAMLSNQVVNGSK